MAKERAVAEDVETVDAATPVRKVQWRLDAVTKVGGGERNKHSRGEGAALGTR